MKCLHLSAIHCQGAALQETVSTSLDVLCASEYVDIGGKPAPSMEQLFHKFAVGGSFQQRPVTPPPADANVVVNDVVEVMADGTEMRERGGMDGSAEQVEETGTGTQCTSKMSPTVFLGLCLLALVILLVSVSSKYEGTRCLSSTMSTVRPMSCLFDLYDSCAMDTIYRQRNQGGRIDAMCSTITMSLFYSDIEKVAPPIHYYPDAYNTYMCAHIHLGRDSPLHMQHLINSKRRPHTNAVRTCAHMYQMLGHDHDLIRSDVRVFLSSACLKIFSLFWDCCL